MSRLILRLWNQYKAQQTALVRCLQMPLILLLLPSPVRRLLLLQAKLLPLPTALGIPSTQAERRDLVHGSARLE